MMDIKIKDFKIQEMIQNKWNPSILNVGNDILKIESREYLFQIYGYKTGGDESEKSEFIEMNFAEKEYFNDDNFDIMPIEIDELEIKSVEGLDYYSVYIFLLRKFMDFVEIETKNPSPATTELEQV